MARAYLNGVGWLEKQTKTVNITDNGSYDIAPDQGKMLSGVTVNVDTEEGKEEGSYNQGFDDGKQAENLAFWNGFTNNQTRKDYSYAFYNWSPDVFFPTCDIGGTTMDRAFYFFGNDYGKLFDLKTRCEELGIKLDFTKTTKAIFCFGSCENLYALPQLEFVKLNAFDGMFNNCKNLKIIEKIVLKEDGTQTFTSNAFNCPALEEVRFEGVIGQNGFNVSYSPLLTHDSLMSIINALEGKAVSYKISGSWKVHDNIIGNISVMYGGALAFSVEGEDAIFEVLNLGMDSAEAIDGDTATFVGLKGKTVDFGTESQEISKQVVDWFNLNATSQGGTITTEAGSVWTVTLGTTNLAKLTDAEKAIATQKGWTLA